jgi:hypothetical protein
MDRKGSESGKKKESLDAAKTAWKGRLAFVVMQWRHEADATERG